jgi:hypothetical protein
MRCFILCFLLTAPCLTWAQSDSVVEVNGIVLAKDSLKPLPSVSIVIRGTNRGTISNDRGVFGIVALLGQEIEITSVGYKPQRIQVIARDDRAHVVIMEMDTTYLETAMIRSRPSRDQFTRDFVNAKVADKPLETAKKNMDPKDLKISAKSVPLSAAEQSDRTLTSNAKTMAIAGTVPDMIGVNLLGLFKGRKKRAKSLPPLGDDLWATPTQAVRDSAIAQYQRDSVLAKARIDSAAARARRDSTQAKHPG